MDQPPFKKKPLFSMSAPLAQFARFGDPSAQPAMKSDRVYSFDCSAEDRDLMNRIVVRVMEIANAHGDFGIEPHLMLMDLMCVHINIQPLHLLRLLMSSDDDITHDVVGIGLHLVRRDGVLRNEFKPRFAAERN